MGGFVISNVPIDAISLRDTLLDRRAGAFASFEGWVRDHHMGQAVRGLRYEAYESLATAEGKRIVDMACEKFAILDAACVHRIGELALGEMAVWVGVSAAHRDAAFSACRYIIDAVKEDVAIWKKEHYEDGRQDWLHPEPAT
ncbi:molybdopterin synthase subunit MoaE [Pseudoxanthomonas sp. 3HH-4]|uniref:molybdenum cofactor biosynthesis protein MoaE n=1 Tax=Pseudoxanthomonas sp. 3HH-4 TaxID=1690214 RepID=UPI0011527E94|nr:molybdenum cofactor biosynthesis protein MoaE [Pseudoxanthomonas sp. 3HH-4]TQM12310.1 molybdopterin synthase subunit MoaE [Pseudoxanthomonas sp. 3HH-4]